MAPQSFFGSSQKSGAPNYGSKMIGCRIYGTHNSTLFDRNYQIMSPSSTQSYLLYTVHVLYTLQHIPYTIYDRSIYLSIHTYIHRYIHTYMHAYIHAYIHTYIYICKHTYFSFSNYHICGGSCQASFQTVARRPATGSTGRRCSTENVKELTPVLLQIIYHDVTYFTTL